jgi:hypothetical protein
MKTSSSIPMVIDALPAAEACQLWAVSLQKGAFWSAPIAYCSRRTGWVRSFQFPRAAAARWTEGALALRGRGIAWVSSPPGRSRLGRAPISAAAYEPGDRIAIH